MNFIPDGVYSVFTGTDRPIDFINLSTSACLPCCAAVIIFVSNEASANLSNNRLPCPIKMRKFFTELEKVFVSTGG